MGAENFPVALRVTAAATAARTCSASLPLRPLRRRRRRRGARRSLRAARYRRVRRARSLPGSRRRCPPVAGAAPDRRPVRCTPRTVPRSDRGEPDRTSATTRYETFDDLLGYCGLSAAPVGRIVLHIAGAAAPDNVADSDAVCAALQVLEHCQDVGEDARAGRVYLPQADLARLGVPTTTCSHRTTSDALRRVVRQQVDRAEQLLHDGRPTGAAPARVGAVRRRRLRRRWSGDGIGAAPPPLRRPRRATSARRVPSTVARALASWRVAR